MKMRRTKSVDRWRMQVPIVTGLLAILLLTVGLGAWGMIAKISGAIVSSGIVQVESLRQIVQHPDGGVVGEINVKNGQSVTAGEILIRFDDEFIRPNITILEQQLAELTARKTRLKAERNGATDLSFDGLDFQADPSGDVVRGILAGQRNLFLARLDSFLQTKEQLGERKKQISLQLDGSQAQSSALETQIELIVKERGDQEGLLKKGLAQASRILALQREEARLKGQFGEVKSLIAARHAQLIETDLEILRLGSQRKEQAETALQELEADQIEISEKLQSAREVFSRLNVKAPVDGLIYGMNIRTLRSVVKPAEPILYIVPQDQKFVVQTRIPSIHIDQVYLGQKSTLHFAAFDQAAVPETTGIVTNISADILVDDRTGVAFYAVELMPVDGALEGLGEIAVLPGMPVEVFIKTGDRTPLSYLLKPFTDYFNRAFRE